MSKYLVIVESPAKAKTIEKFLGKQYKVMASIGHIRDLPKSKMGVNIENDFNPEYINIRGKGSVIKELKTAAKKADKVYLATDPDREGEAIAWHLCFILGLDIEKDVRVTFHEITKDAIVHAVMHPRAIDLSLVDAQQARRVLDRLVGYSISPILWRKVKKGLSAGRVQSVSTKLICDREEQISRFEPEEYWTVEAQFMHQSSQRVIEAELTHISGKKSDLNNESNVNAFMKSIEGFKPAIVDVATKVKNRAPSPCFITSSLQQESSNRFGFSTSKTMMLAQQLYEGISVPGKGTVGLITYMRTDSTRISDEAKNALKDFIQNQFGEAYLNDKTRKKAKAKAAQDAHEAIRPTYVDLTPEALEGSLNKDQQKLYSLIWQRFVASEMSDAKFDSTTIDIQLGEANFRTNGVKLKFDGFLKVYTYTSISENLLPDIELGDLLSIVRIEPEQHFTQPPARYTEASLVKEMEELGIGRPSTYAPTISTIIDRGYVERDKKSLKPTELGFIINEIMVNYFSSIVDTDFTAGMENKLDGVEEGNIEWKQIIREFYRPFESMLTQADAELEKLDFTEKTDIPCAKCGSFMNIKHGKYGKFLACSEYPTCDYTKAILNEIGMKCPVCNEGEVVERKTKKFKTFFGCSRFPDCNFVSWSKPIERPCPDCGGVLVEKITKKTHAIICSNKDCKHKEVI